MNNTIELTEIKQLRLSDLSNGEAGIIVKVYGHGAFRKRITEMGFVKGKKVKVIKHAPLQDPVEYEIMDYRVSLRKTEASLIEVIAPESDDPEIAGLYEGTIDENILKTTVGLKGKEIKVALVGNPNSGKTTLFNYASGSHERVGNYGGVTVDAKESTFNQSGYSFSIVDLPGTYSITEYSPEELFVRMHIMDNNPDVVVNVVDASNLERNLYLTTQLIDMNIKVVIALNMFDELENKRAKFDYNLLGKMIGVPIIPTTASKGIGIKELFDKIIDVYEDRDETVRHIHINYGTEIENAIAAIQPIIKADKEITDKYSSRYLSIKLLETDKTTMNMLQQRPGFTKLKEAVSNAITNLESEYKEKSETVITDAKYGFIAGALNETFIPGAAEIRNRTTSIDFIMTHRFLGFPVFIFFMWLMFQTTFSLGSYPMDWIDAGVGLLSSFIQNTMPDGSLRDLIVDGVMGGVGGVIIFLPNILILFFFISFMEDSGYMARASFIMDKLMHKIGLHGKSFIPLIMGFGCNVPAIMSTRMLENKKDRLLTMLIIPFMSCSARLPVYVLFISAFFPKNQGLVLLSIYVIGIVIAIGVALIMQKLFFAKKEVPFVMELPPYRVPTLRNTSKHMWHKAVQYLKKMGNVILFASILIWALGYYPKNSEVSEVYDSKIQQVTNDVSISDEQKNDKVAQLEVKRNSELQEKSYIGQLGHMIEPVIYPLGFDWKIGVSILTGLAAKEIVVGTMGVLYAGNLHEKLQEQVHTHGELKGQKVFSPLVAYGLMLFVLIYFPCVAVIAAIRKEANWRWAVFTMFYTTAIAWIAAFLVYQVGSLFI